MCLSNSDYQLLNPTTQLSLFSSCIPNCSSIENIHWNIYQRSMNSSWTLFNQKNISLRFLSDENTINLISTNEFFLQNSQINYWRFEVIYTFKTRKSSSSLDFIRNECTSNGFCSIHLFNGTTKTLFTILLFQLV